MKYTLVLAVAAMAGISSANFVVNGSFESGSFPGAPFDTLGVGNTNMTGWTIDSGSIDWIGGYWQASDGNRSLDMSGSSAGQISQNLNLTAGQVYHLTFDYSGNPDSNINKALNVKIDNLNAFAFYNNVANGNTAGNMKYKTFSANFTASGSDNLVFKSLNAGVFGIALDNVQVQAVPEPASLAALAIGAASLLRRRKSS